MKKITLGIISLLISVISFAQMGVNFGASTSWFAGPGVKYYQGIDKASTGVKIGLDYNFKLSRTLDFKTDIAYLHLGQRNQAEKLANFSTYHASLTGLLGLKLGNLKVNGGMYVNRLILARSNAFYGDNFHWNTSRWDYYKKWNYGVATGLEYDFIGATLETRFIYSLRQVRNVYYNDPRLWRSHDEAIIVTLNIPFKTLFYRDQKRKAG